MNIKVLCDSMCDIPEEIKEKDYEKLLFDIFKWGGLPQRFLFNSDDDKYSYLSSVYDSIILKDKIGRAHV